MEGITTTGAKYAEWGANTVPIVLNQKRVLSHQRKVAGQEDHLTDALYPFNFFEMVPWGQLLCTVLVHSELHSRRRAKQHPNYEVKHGDAYMRTAAMIFR